jgi:hypothetical protein
MHIENVFFFLSSSPSPMLILLTCTVLTRPFFFSIRIIDFLIYRIHQIIIIFFFFFSFSFPLAFLMPLPVVYLYFHMMLMMMLLVAVDCGSGLG